MGLQTAPTAAPSQTCSAIPVANRTATSSSSPPTSSHSLSSATSSAPSSPRPTSSPNRSSDSAPSLNPKIASRTPRTPPPPPGLFNLGNTCYLNSVVQVLYHVSSFRKAILTHSHRPPDPKRSPSLQFACDLVAALRAVFEELDQARAAAIRSYSQPPPPSPHPNGLRTPTRSQTHAPLHLTDDAQGPMPSVEDQDAFLRDGVDYVAPQRMIDLLRDHERCPEFDARGQQDAHEFLRFLLDKVNDCMQMMQEDEDVDIVDINAHVPNAAPSKSLIHCKQYHNDNGELRSMTATAQPTTAGLAPSSNSASLPPPSDDRDCDENSPPLSNAESKQAKSATYATGSNARQLEVSSPSLEQTRSDKSVKQSGDAKGSDDVPGPGVQAPISSTTAVESRGSDINFACPISLDYKSSSTQGEEKTLAASSSSGSDLNSARKASKDDEQKSPATKRRRRDWEAGTRDESATGKGESGDVPSSTRPTEQTRQWERESHAVRRSAKRYRKKLVPDLFEGQAVTATRCYECDSQSDRCETFLDISLPVEHGKNLDWAMSTQCVEEQLVDKNKYFCDNCRTYTEAKRWWQVASLPEVLTVHLKLFAYSVRLAAPGGKVSVAMPCPIRTQLAQWCISDCLQREDDYKLTAVIVHEGGTVNSGHYYSYICKTGQEAQWYCFDDAYVQAVSEEEVKSRLFTTMKTRRTAYLLFYSNSRDLDIQRCF